MPRYVALLRAVNVAGRKLPMGDLRRLLSEAGYGAVATYIQSGNVVLSSPVRRRDQLALAIDNLVMDGFGLAVGTVAVEASELTDIVKANPYAPAAVIDPKSVHVLFTRDTLGSEAAARFAVAEKVARGGGGRDELTVSGRVAYLHLPNGLARSELVTRLSRGGKKATIGTIRNWRTVEALLAMC